MPWYAYAAMAGISAVQSIHGTRSASKQNKKAIEASERSDVRARELEDLRLAEQKRADDARLAEERRDREARLQYDRDEAARKERQYNEAAARDQARWQDYLRINEPMWRQGAGVLGSLYDIAGAGPAPQFQMPTQPPPAPMGGAPGGPGPRTGPPPPDIRTGTAASRDPSTTGGYVYRGPGSQGRTFPTMPIPSGQGQSLQNLMQLATLAGTSSKMPVPKYQGDVLAPLATA